MVGIVPDASNLIDLFRGEVFKMLKREGKIDDHIIENMLNWHHSGFNVYCGPAINPGDQEGLAQYIIRVPYHRKDCSIQRDYLAINGKG